MSAEEREEQFQRVRDSHNEDPDSAESYALGNAIISCTELICQRLDHILIELERMD